MFEVVIGDESGALVCDERTVIGYVGSAVA